MYLVRIPKASENLEAATIGKWLKAEGDAVAEGEPVVEVLTDKADFAIEAERAGQVRRIVAPEKSTLPVGYIIAVIADNSEPLPDIDAENRSICQAAAAAPAKPDKTGPAARSALSGRKIAATPAARRIARERGVDLAAVAAALDKTGVLTAEDVEAYLARGA